MMIPYCISDTTGISLVKYMFNKLKLAFEIVSRKV